MSKIVTLRLIDGTFHVRLEGTPDQQGPSSPLLPGALIEISPVSGIWYPGTYGVDRDHNEHYWISYDGHFVGLLDGMQVRMERG